MPPPRGWLMLLYVLAMSRESPVKLRSWPGCLRGPREPGKGGSYETSEGLRGLKTNHANNIESNCDMGLDLAGAPTEMVCSSQGLAHQHQDM